ncbi:Rho GTPase-activating protein [Pseudohyphozyma bogoriensis]|nr:Rho GTPase-activating protein [Pseudohyphozyma bogoriensis]
MSDTTEDKGKEKEVPTPPPATVVLPLTFANSALYNRLEAGTVESSEILANINRRAQAEHAYAAALHPSALKPDGFGIDEGASLKIGLEVRRFPVPQQQPYSRTTPRLRPALLTSTVQEARAHAQLADELIRSIAAPFDEWSESHKGRIRSSRTLVDSHLSGYEKKFNEVTKLKHQYDEACRTADAMEDELAFSRAHPTSASPSPISPPTSSPQTPLKDSPLPASPTAAAAAPAPAMERQNSEGPDDDDDDDKTLVGRSGATGGSLTAALGRAFTVRRGGRGASKEEGAKDGKELPAKPLINEFIADPNVAAAMDWSKSRFNSLLERVAGPQTGEGKNDKARRDAETTEEKYKAGVETLDQHRLTLEETLSEHLTYLNRCEADRLKAATSVLRSFHALLLSFPSRLQGASDKVQTALQLIRPERDVVAIIERLRTGPFQPRPTVYHSHYSEPAIHAFGIDLRKFDETNTLEDKVPPILTFLLEYVKDASAKVANVEQRKAWLYETPLAAQHHLRSALNGGHLDRAIVEKYDLPVVVSTIKLWLLELDVPVVIFSHYTEFRELYPKRVGTEATEVPPKLIASHIARLPPVHLEVLRVLIRHFKDLLASTKTEESDEVYLQKLALSVARCIVRPKQESALTLDEKFPALLFIDLVKHFDEIFSSADELKTKQREDRYKPRRQRTKPVDVRISRTNLGVDANASVDLSKAGELLKELRGGVTSPPPVPPVPDLAKLSVSDITPSAPFSTSPMAASPIAVSPATALPAEQEPAAVASSTESTAPGAISGSGTGSLKRSDGRRGMRGPRPLPNAGLEPSAPPAEEMDEQTEGKKRPAEDERPE